MFNNSYSINYLNSNKLNIAREIADLIIFESKLDIEKYGITYDSIVQYSMIDLSKLFLSLLSEKPTSFMDYITEKRNFYKKLKLSDNIAREHISVLARVIKKHMPDLYRFQLEGVFEYGLKVFYINKESNAVITPFSPMVDQIISRFIELVDSERWEEAADFISGLKSDHDTAFIMIIISNIIELVKSKNPISIKNDEFSKRFFQAIQTAVNKLSSYNYELKSRQPILLTTPYGEKHSLPLSMLKEVLRSEGYSIKFVPELSLSNVAQVFKEDQYGLVIISATLVPLASNVNELIKSIRLNCDNYILAGGQLFEKQPELVEEFGLDYFIKNFDAILEIIGSFFQKNV